MKLLTSLHNQTNVITLNDKKSTSQIATFSEKGKFGMVQVAKEKAIRGGDGPRLIRN